MDEELKGMIKYLHLSGLAKNWDEYLKITQKNNFSSVRTLKYVIEQEYRIKQENSRQLRLKKARIPEAYTIETFPFQDQPVCYDLESKFTMGSSPARGAPRFSCISSHLAILVAL